VTASVAVPETGGLVPGTVAVMVAVLGADTDAAAVARPLEPEAFEMLATFVAEELHVTVVVRSTVLESE
jgi:hypothetical protein